MFSVSQENNVFFGFYLAVVRDDDCGNRVMGTRPVSEFKRFYFLYIYLCKTYDFCPKANRTKNVMVYHFG